MPAKKKAAKKVAKKKVTKKAVTKKKVTKKAPATKKAKKTLKPSSPLDIMKEALKEGPPDHLRSVFVVLTGDEAIINGRWTPDWETLTCGEVYQNVEDAQHAARGMDPGSAIARFTFSGYPAMSAPEPEQFEMSEPELWEASW